MHNRLHASASSSEPIRIDRIVCIATITLGLLVSLFYWWNRQGLWEDEIIAITHANQPFPLFFIEVLRNDVHPPIYFLQLKLWQQPGFHSDQAILANSLVWAAISLCALFYMARAVYGAKAAWYAAAIYADWDMLRYALGPNWGRPLEVMPLEPNPQWASLTAKLGPEVTDRLGLRPETDTVTHNGVRYAIGQDARQATAQAKRVWGVHRDGYRVDVELGGPFMRHSMVRAGNSDLVVSRFDSGPYGKTVAGHPLQLDQDDVMTVETASAL